jgi:glutamate transport system substrate-binding protein
MTRSRIQLAALVSVLLVSACADVPSVPAPSGSNTPRPTLSGQHHLRIAIKTDEPGIGLMSSTNSDDVSGLDIDIATYVAKGLVGPDVKITWVPVTSKKREDLIADGDVDLVVASYSITDYRLQKVDFAGPYLITEQDILIRTEDRGVIAGVVDLSGQTVCTVENSTPKTRLEQFNADGVLRPPAKVLALRTYSECIQKLLSGADGVRAVSTDSAILAGYLQQDEFRDKLDLIGQSFAKEKEKYGIGLAYGHSADCKKINDLLRRLIKDGTWETLVRRNLGARADIVLRSRPAPGDTVKTCVSPT